MNFQKRMWNMVQANAGHLGGDGAQSAFRTAWKETAAKRAKRKTARASRKRNRA